MGADLFEYFESTVESRYRYPEPDGIEVREYPAEDMMFDMDETPASVVYADESSGRAENSAAFITQEYGEPINCYEFLDGDESLGYLAIVEDPDGRELADMISEELKIPTVPGKAVFAFSPEGLDQYDIKIE
jgi:hypothetical protein